MNTAINTVDVRMPSPPRKPLPAGACDVHCHVFGPLETFPTGPATYGIPLAPPQVYRHMLDTAGFSRGVLVQPAPYGIDTRALVNALEVMGDRVRGIAVADSNTSSEELQRLHRAGVRGLRFIEMLDPTTRQRYAGSIGIDTLKCLAPNMRALGWQAHIWARAADCPAVFEQIQDLDVPVVFDHMGQFDVSQGVNCADFRNFIALLETGRVWTKLSLCRVSKQAPHYDDVKPFHQAMIEARPDRLLWGSDWPFVRMAENSPDVGHLLDIFQTWVNDDAVVHQILVDNPAQLFGF